MILYKITNLINGKKYIGQTIRNLSIRWKQHLRKEGNCYALHAAFKKYGNENFEIKILVKCNSIEELNHREEYYIKLLNTMSPNGYNLIGGGNSKVNSAETIKRKTEANIRNASRPGAKEKNRKARMNYLSNNPNYGRIHSLKLKKRYIEDPSLLERAAVLKGGKPFNVFNKNTMELVWSGINQKECQKTLGVKQGNISNCLKLKKKTCNGYIFRYLDEENVKYPTKSGTTKKIFNVETKEIFDSSRLAAMKYDLWARNIRKAATNGSSSGGYHWEFLGK